MSYRQSPAFHAAVIVAAAQRRTLKFRRLTLTEGRAPAVVIRTRRTVRS